MNYGFIRKNINSFAIIIFLVSFVLLNYFCFIKNVVFVFQKRKKREKKFCQTSKNK